MGEEPDLTLAGLSIWARSREFSESDDHWDGNWIDIRARVEAPGAFVETSGHGSVAMRSQRLRRNWRFSIATCAEPPNFDVWSLCWAPGLSLAFVGTWK